MLSRKIALGPITRTDEETDEITPQHADFKLNSHHYSMAWGR